MYKSERSMQRAGDYPKLVLGGWGSLRGWVAFPYGVLHQTPVGGSCFVGYLTSQFWQFLGFYMKFCPAYAPRGRTRPAPGGCGRGGRTRGRISCKTQETARIGTLSNQRSKTRPQAFGEVRHKGRQPTHEDYPNPPAPIWDNHLLFACSFHSYT